MHSNKMRSIKVTERARRRRATINLSSVLGCHRSTYNRRWNKIRTAFMKKHNLLSLSEFANESTVKAVEREITRNESPSTVTPSTSYSNQRLLDNNGSDDVQPKFSSGVDKLIKRNRRKQEQLASQALSDVTNIPNDSSSSA
ncbi:unnamed protein product [Schistosoma spindalis]|nr:unnamed protein product [Schistosoma spindale]